MLLNLISFFFFKYRTIKTINYAVHIDELYKYYLLIVN